MEEYFGYNNDVNEDFNKVCVFTPKVMGQTGLESADLVKGVVDLFKPNLIIIIDALALLYKELGQTKKALDM